MFFSLFYSLSPIYSPPYREGQGVGLPLFTPLHTGRGRGEGLLFLLPIIKFVVDICLGPWSRFSYDHLDACLSCIDIYCPDVVT